MTNTSKAEPQNEASRIDTAQLERVSGGGRVLPNDLIVNNDLSNFLGGAGNDLREVNGKGLFT